MTAFQIAFAKAQERADDKKSITKKSKVTTQEQEEILNRTLENRITTG